MIIVLKQTISPSEKANIKKILSEKGFLIKEIVGKEETVLGAVGTVHIDPREVEILKGVASVLPISKPYKLASRELKKEDTIVQVGNVRIGGNSVAIIAGPCAVESREQIMEIAKAVRESGAVMLRGGAFKPRTSPYSFQGLGEEGLKYLKEAGLAYNMPVTSEVVSPKDVAMMKEYIDMFQIGARNMQNFELLKEVGKTGFPVLLKRGLSATIEEWLMAAEYLMANGTDQVVLCERGIRTYERATRNTLDCSAIPVVQKLSHLPVIGDPSHATGFRDMVSPMSLALVASGASGLIVEVHNHPEKAFSDGPQSLFPKQFEKLVRDVQSLSPVVGKALERIPRIIPDTIKDGKATSSTPSSNRVAFQGERGAFSELALRRTFPSNIKVMPLDTFKEVFESVSSGNAAYGVLPVENTLGGTIFDTLDLLAIHSNLTVVGEQNIRIIHNLIGFKGTELNEIKEVYSHPQGLLQCKDFLEKNLPYAKAMPFFDTAGAVSYVKKRDDKSICAIAGAPAAKYNNLEILVEGIESNPLNYTRFYIISREENAASFRSGAQINRASILFSVSDTTGALFNVLKVLTENGLNMKKLESRPIPGKPWEYSFFLEIELESEEVLKKVTPLIKEATSSFRILGLFSSSH